MTAESKRRRTRDPRRGFFNRARTQTRVVVVKTCREIYLQNPTVQKFTVAIDPFRDSRRRASSRHRRGFAQPTRSVASVIVQRVRDATVTGATRPRSNVSSLDIGEKTAKSASLVARVDLTNCVIQRGACGALLDSPSSRARLASARRRYI